MSTFYVNSADAMQAIWEEVAVWMDHGEETPISSRGVWTLHRSPDFGIFRILEAEPAPTDLSGFIPFESMAAFQNYAMDQYYAAHPSRQDPRGRSLRAQLGLA